MSGENTSRSSKSSYCNYTMFGLGIVVAILMIVFAIYKYKNMDDREKVLIPNWLKIIFGLSLTLFIASIITCWIIG